MLILIITAVRFALTASERVTIEPSAMEQTTEERALSPFTSLELDGRFMVRVYEAEVNEETAVVTADKAFLPYVKTEVQDGRLSISTSPRHQLNWPPSLPIASIVIKRGDRTIRALGLSGRSSLIIVPEIIANESFAMKLSGPSYCQVRIKSSHVIISATDDATTELSGSAEQAMFRVSGRAYISAEHLRSKATVASASGLGRITTWTTHRLSAQTSDLGTILYRGNPPTVAVRADGGFISHLSYEKERE